MTAVSGISVDKGSITEYKEAALGRVAQRESTGLTSRGSQVQILFRLPKSNTSRCHRLYEFCKIAKSDCPRFSHCGGVVQFG